MTVAAATTVVMGAAVVATDMATATTGATNLVN
jgi:hypothetical protein